MTVKELIKFLEKCPLSSEVFMLSSRKDFSTGIGSTVGEIVIELLTGEVDLIPSN